MTVDFATGLEEAIANTRVYASEGAICIEPAMPMDVTVVSMTGQLIYTDAISSSTTVTVSGSGIYLVKLGKGNDVKVHKVNVR